MTKTNKRYFWLKLKDDFFSQKEIKMLRKIAGGDTYTIIYLKMLLLSLKNEGKIYFDDIASDFVEEIALDIDEETENVQITFNYLKQKGLIEFENDSEIDMVNIASMIGSETDKAAIMRRKRARDKLTKSNDVTPVLPDHYPEIEIELEKDIDIEKEREKEQLALFEKWWKLYPKKTGSKKKVRTKFDKAIKEVGEEQFFAATEIYLKTQDEIQFICGPEVFINQERYSEDAMETNRQIVHEKGKKQMGNFKNGQANVDLNTPYEKDLTEKLGF